MTVSKRYTFIPFTPALRSQRDLLVFLISEYIMSAMRAVLFIASLAVAATAIPIDRLLPRGETFHSQSYRRRAQSHAAGDFGSCSDPTIIFADGLDGRNEAAFAPNNEADFNHGSALNIGVISSFICGQLQSKCQADQSESARVRIQSFDLTMLRSCNISMC